MSMVAKYMAALVTSAILTAFGHILVAGASADLILQPHFWVTSVSLAALAGLAMGSGIGSVERRSNVVRMVPASAKPVAVAIAA